MAWGLGKQWYKAKQTEQWEPKRAETSQAFTEELKPLHEKAGKKNSRMYKARLRKAQNVDNLSKDNPEQDKMPQDLGIHSLGTANLAIT